MLKLEEKIQIRNFVEVGYSVPEIARRLGYSTATIYKYKNSREQTITNNYSDLFLQKNYSQKISSFTNYLNSRIKNNITNATKLYDEIGKQGYRGSYGLVNNYLKSRKKNLERYKRSIQVTLGPGEQAQVDWGSFGRIIIDEKEEKLYAFIYVLSYSRAMYVEFVVSQNQKTFQNCHINAFEKLGIPKSIAYDNVKTVVLSREKLPDGYKPHYNPTFLDFASYYGFKPFICPPYWPRSKGRVESGVKYLRNNFMNGNLAKKESVSLEDLNKKVTKWMDEIANVRIHKTTKGKPYELWLKEKDFLQFPNKLPSYETSSFSERFSTKDGLVQYKSCFYSIPQDFARKKLYVRDISRRGLPYVEIYFEDQLIAIHKMSYDRGKWVIDDKHFEKRQTNRKVATKDRKRIVLRRTTPRTNIAIRDLKFYNLLLSKNKNVKKKS